MDDMDQGFFDLFRSPTYWKLREAFVKAADAGDEYAFMTAVWRGYNAGRVSPDRFIPNTAKELQSSTALGIASTHAADARRATSRRAKGVGNAK
ncbi:MULTISPECIES: hypothetical protein [Acidobacteriaceae]|uniref:hypothetical protein n=1 Tax=Acidobacteriaceae TaxID=204434 RepID=UPI00131B452A|nr:MULTISPECIES: hypothetical protein [Acidobacteriaceae]MDW5266935.1 hypothetical protein [Edaphobacter sp.]